MKEKKGLVPRLRFPEFWDAGEWPLASLKQLATRRTERNRDGEVVRVLTNSAEHGVVDQRDYFEKDIATQGNLENYFIVDEGDFVYNPRISTFAPVGPISQNTVAKGVMSPLYTVFRFNNPDNLFYKHYFKSSGWHLYMRQVGSTGARHDRMAIGNEDFMAMPLPKPPPEEQKKIADCISSLDALITAQADKLDALKTHKKGLMQQLFPREGETVPRLCFPEFREAGEWENITLGKIAKFISGGTPSKDVADYWKGSIPWISASSMHDIKIEKSDFSITDSAVKAGARIAEKGTLLLLVRGSMLHKRIPMGISAIDVAFNQDIKALELKGNITAEYLIYFLSARESELLGQVTSTGIGAGKLDTLNLKEFPVVIPVAKEQQKIADCLSSLDALIAAQADKLDALKTHKKGLMQQLFPNPEAVAA